MNIAILLYEGLTALDAVGPYEVLSRLPRASVQFVAKDVGPKQTDTQSLSLVAKFRLTDVPKPDILVIPGGTSGTNTAAKIAGQDIAQAIQLAIEYDSQPPFDSGSLQRASDTIVNIAKGRLKRQLTKETGRAFLQKVIKPFRS
jgi:hypothetical protein